MKELAVTSLTRRACGAGNRACSRLPGGSFGPSTNPYGRPAPAESRRQPGLAAPLLVIVVGLVSLGFSGAASNEETFKARLSTVAMDLSMRANISGTGSVT